MVAIGSFGRASVAPLMFVRLETQHQRLRIYGAYDASYTSTGARRSRWGSTVHWITVEVEEAAGAPTQSLRRSEPTGAGAPTRAGGIALHQPLTVRTDASRSSKQHRVRSRKHDLANDTSPDVPAEEPVEKIHVGITLAQPFF